MHCSDQQLKLALTNGLIIGTTLTAQDVDAYKAIYKPCLVYLAGKVIAPSYRHDSDTAPATEIGRTIHFDLLMFEQAIVGGIMQQMFSVDEYSANKHITQMKNTYDKHITITAINFAFCDLISYYHSHGWKINTIITDSESVLRAARVYLGHQGIILKHTPPHAQRAERHIRSRKDRHRTIITQYHTYFPTDSMVKYTRQQHTILTIYHLHMQTQHRRC
jgi:hypothetical protein